jgi:hypothetical protein
MADTQHQALTRHPLTLPSVLRSTARRVRDMVLVWALFGVVCGLMIGWDQRSLVALVSGMIAGALVLPVLGAFLGVIGGQWKETLAGGLGGLVLGALAAALSGRGSMPHLAQVGMIFGGLVGATFLSLFARLPRLLWAQAFPRA